MEIQRKKWLILLKGRNQVSKGGSIWTGPRKMNSRIISQVKEQCILGKKNRMKKGIEA